MRFISGYIGVLHRFALQYFNRWEEETGLRGVQYPFLFYICRHEGCRQEELARHLHINKSSVTRQLDKLQQNGFIEIRPDEKDGRSNCIWPTERALCGRKRIKQVLEDWNQIVTRSLDEDETEQLKALLDKALQGVKEWDEQ